MSYKVFNSKAYNKVAQDTKSRPVSAEQLHAIIEIDSLKHSEFPNKYY